MVQIGHDSGGLVGAALREGRSVLSTEEPEEIERKVAAALERIAQALRVLLWGAAKRTGLSPMQCQTLLYLAQRREDAARVSRLAREFGVTQATVSDAVSSLEQKGLVARGAASDKRASVLSLTPRSRALVATELERWADPMRAAIAELPRENREALLPSLMDVIRSLQRTGVITVARMCITCRFFSENAQKGKSPKHYCQLLQVPLAPLDLRVDCPEHEPVRFEASTGATVHLLASAP
jgi:DNA-binding MarR family transcriptional regulator